MRIVIYGRPGCVRCAQALAVLTGEAEYREHGDLYLDFDTDTAVEIATCTGGELPIVVIETAAGRIALGMGAGGHASACEGGACRIDV